MTDMLRLIRAPNLVIAAGGVLAGGWIGQGRIAVPTALLRAALSGAALGAAGNALNDLLDLEADRQNRPDRPVPAGRVARQTVVSVVVAGAAIGLGLAVLVSLRQVLVALA